MIDNKWIMCPICGNKTRLKIQEDTELKNHGTFQHQHDAELLCHATSDSALAEMEWLIA